MARRAVRAVRARARVAAAGAMAGGRSGVAGAGRKVAGTRSGGVGHRLGTPCWGAGVVDHIGKLAAEGAVASGVRAQTVDEAPSIRVPCLNQEVMAVVPLGDSRTSLRESSVERSMDHQARGMTGTRIELEETRRKEDQMSGNGTLSAATRRAVAVAIWMAVFATGATAMQTAEQERRLQRETVADLRSGDPERMGSALAMMAVMPPAEWGTDLRGALLTAFTREIEGEVFGDDPHVAIYPMFELAIQIAATGDPTGPAPEAAAAARPSRSAAYRHHAGESTRRANDGPPRPAGCQRAGRLRPPTPAQAFDGD